jgi:hypothetical protein
MLKSAVPLFSATNAAGFDVTPRTIGLASTPPRPSALSVE